MGSKALSLNEIRARIDVFVTEWRFETSENAESQSFWNDFFNCFGINRRRVATYEKWATRASTGGRGRIDVFWPGMLIAEQKSVGAMKDDSAEQQATDYLVGGDIKPHEYPRYIISSDFATIRLTDLEAPSGAQTVTFPITELADHVEQFAWIAGYKTRTFSTEAEEAASVEAATLMANLYVALTGDADVDADTVENPTQEDTTSLNVSVMMTRLLFLMFGDDAGLWEKGIFDDFLKTRTADDGSDMGGQLNTLFDVLNTPEHQRSPHLDDTMRAFPYVNGALFSGHGVTQFFDTTMRDALLEASAFEWAMISPAVFGSLFQAIKSKDARRGDGEHYTTETNILKTLEPLFLDDVRAALRKAWHSSKKLKTLHNSFADMQYLDPACGCGNFLIVAYREMRRIELDLLVRLRELEGDAAQWSLQGDVELHVSLDQFHGIELNWWPAKIAETAMFLVDHQANREMALALGQAPERLPINITAHIHHGNALTTDWGTVCPVTDSQTVMVFGNPPFAGHKERNLRQTTDLKSAWGEMYNGYLDYVTGWHATTLKFLKERRGSFAFVSTNSIVQGEAVTALFDAVAHQMWAIKFAHRTFAWKSEATGKAAVHCVIVGFSREDEFERTLYTYSDINGTPVGETRKGQTICRYLLFHDDVAVHSRKVPLSPELPKMSLGSIPYDWGNLTVEPDDFEAVVADPIAAKYLRRFINGKELINNAHRWCLWMENLSAEDISQSRLLKTRIEAVVQKRMASKDGPTRALASTPHLMRPNPNRPTGPYLAVPGVFAESRRFATAARFEPDVVSGGKIYNCTDRDGLAFAIISSSMFIVWQKTVGGRIKSDPSFSTDIVWNNLPLPALHESTRTKVIAAGNSVLAARSLHPERSLAEHYNPLNMDPALVAAHKKLDGVVDRAFGATKTCTTESERQNILFNQYAELSNPL